MLLVMDKPYFQLTVHSCMSLAMQRTHEGCTRCTHSVNGCCLQLPCRSLNSAPLLCRMNIDARNAGVGIALDGVQPFKDDSRYSIWPLVLTVYNLPPWIRYKLGATTVLTMIPGNRHPDAKLDLDFVMQLVQDDLSALYVHGVTVYDAFCCKPAR
jgi:hypothetical protein